MATTGGLGRATTRMAERSEVLAALERLLDDAGEGRGGALFVVGAAGLGKTTVLEHAISRARPRFAVGVGRGDQVEAVLPFGLIGQALDQLLTDTLPAHGMMLDADGGEAADISPQARFYRILRGIRAAAVRPLLLAIDDVHWSDPDSLTAIHLICRRLATLPVALIATTRPWPATAVTSARDLAAQGLAQIEPLAPLSAVTSRSLLRARLSGTVQATVVDQAVELCGGNPLLVEEAALELRRGGTLAQGQVWFSRFAGAGAAGQRYLQAASVLGVRFRADVATQVAGLVATDTDTAADIDGLFRGGLLFEDDDGWARFTHALIRQAVYDDIAPPVRMDLHAACFRMLVASGAYPAEAAEHAVAAALTGDPEAVATLSRAGRAALRCGAVRAARQHLAAAVRLAGGAATIELLFDFGAALATDGAHDEAITVYERLLGLPELGTTDRVAALRGLGQASFIIGQVERASGCCESAVGLAESDHPALAVGALLDQSFHHQALFGPSAALPWASRAVELATAGGVMQASAQAVWGAIAHRCGDPDGLRTAARATASHADLIPTGRSRDRHRDPVLSYAILAVQAEQFTDAERLLTGILSSAEHRGEPLTVLQAAMAWVDCLCRLGRLTEARAVVERLIELVELFPHGSPLAITHQAVVLLELGQLEEATRCCARLPTSRHQDRYSLHRCDGWELHVRGVLAYRQGDADTACSMFARLQEWADRTGELDPSFVPWAADAIAAYLASGREASARHVIDWVAQRAVTLRAHWPKIVVTSGQAALAVRAGNRALAESYYAQALKLHQELPMPLSRVTTLTDYGAFLAGGGEHARARRLLSEARLIAETCGATWHAGRARAEWERAGERTRSRKLVER